jgi:hypothetical protein
VFNAPQGLCNLLQHNNNNNNNNNNSNGNNNNGNGSNSLKLESADLDHVIRADHDYIELRVQVKEETDDDDAEDSDPGDLKIVEPVASLAIKPTLFTAMHFKTKDKIDNPQPIEVCLRVRND